MTVNIRLRLARVEQGLTQRQLALKAGLRESDVSRLETGRTDPDADTKSRLAEVLGKPTYELFSA